VCIVNSASTQLSNNCDASPSVVIDLSNDYVCVTSEKRTVKRTHVDSPILISSDSDNDGEALSTPPTKRKKRFILKTRSPNSQVCSEQCKDSIYAERTLHIKGLSGTIASVTVDHLTTVQQTIKQFLADNQYNSDLTAKLILRHNGISTTLESNDTHKILSILPEGLSELIVVIRPRKEENTSSSSNDSQVESSRRPAKRPHSLMESAELNTAKDELFMPMPTKKQALSSEAKKEDPLKKLRGALKFQFPLPETGYHAQTTKFLVQGKFEIVGIQHYHLSNDFATTYSNSHSSLNLCSTIEAIDAAEPISSDKLRVALLIGESAVTSMLPALAKHCDLILLADYDPHMLRNTIERIDGIQQASSFDREKRQDKINFVEAACRPSKSLYPGLTSFHERMAAILKLKESLRKEYDDNKANLGSLHPYHSEAWFNQVQAAAKNCPAIPVYCNVVSSKDMNNLKTVLEKNNAQLCVLNVTNTLEYNNCGFFLAHEFNLTEGLPTPYKYFSRLPIHPEALCAYAVHFPKAPEKNYNHCVRYPELWPALAKANYEHIEQDARALPIQLNEKDLPDIIQRSPQRNYLKLVLTIIKNVEMAFQYNRHHQDGALLKQLIGISNDEQLKMLASFAKSITKVNDEHPNSVSNLLRQAINYTEQT